MAVYLQSATEENLYLCALHGLWGSKSNRLSNWDANDTLILYVDRSLAALFTITGEHFHDEEPVWPGDLYPYRIPMRLDKIIRSEDRYSLSNADTRDVLWRHHSKAYGVSVVLAARPLDDEPARLLLQHIDEAPDWSGFDAEQELRTLKEQQAAEQAAIAEEVAEARPDEIQHETDLSPHTQMQSHLAQLGRSLGFQIWIPKADQGKTYQGKSLGEFSLLELPHLPFNDEVIRIVRNIDVIWLHDQQPTHLFEVEHTTTVYSGLLRMSDLATLIPYINIQMYICASDERRDKVIAEVNRPTFARGPAGLADRCRLIPFERLEIFMNEQHDYLPFFQMAILDELSEPLTRQPV